MSNNQAIETNKNEESNEALKAYARPELVKHGNVEKLTQGHIFSHPSNPWSYGQE